MLSLLPFDALVVELPAIAFGYLPEIRQKHIHALVLAKNGRSDAAFAAAEHYQTLAFVHIVVSLYVVLIDHRILSVTNVTAASRMATIQKRTTIFDSGMALSGACMRASMPELPGFWKW